MEEQLKLRYSWVVIATFPSEDEPFVDDLDYVFYSLNLPIRRTLNSAGDWEIAVPWSHESACRSAFDAYMKHLLDYPKEFEYYKIPEPESICEPVNSRYSARSMRFAVTLAFLLGLYIIMRWIVDLQR